MRMTISSVRTTTVQRAAASATSAKSTIVNSLSVTNAERGVVRQPAGTDLFVLGHHGLSENTNWVLGETED